MAKVVFADIDVEIKKLMRSKSEVSVDLPNKSALDWKIEKKLEANLEEERRSLLHRMVIISKLHGNDFDQIGGHYDKLFRDLVASFNCEGVTGMLLLYPRHSVHVIETCNELMVEYCKDLLKEEKGEAVHMERSKILVCSQDITNRLYQNWSYRVIDTETANAGDFEPQETVEKLVLDMLVQLLHLGSFLSKNGKASTKATDKLHLKVPEHMPLQPVVAYLVERDDSDTGCCMTISEYVSLYSTPYDLALESEFTWPMPIRQFPYN